MQVAQWDKNKHLSRKQEFSKEVLYIHSEINDKAKKAGLQK